MQFLKQNPPTGLAKFSSCFAAVCGSLALAVGIALCPSAAHAQEQHPPQVAFPTAPDALPGPSSADPGVRRMMRKMARERNIERQKKIQADTARLLELAKQLHAAVADSSKDTLSLDVVKHADEIEKLAKTIKDKMRDGE